jgi:phenylpropionate dioxygenase-like ring-hydroxylating dioxygenase large terminal subunit
MTTSQIVLQNLLFRYHGWTYNSRGELIKAPQFDHVEGFDRSKNGLFEIRVHITSQGLIFVNLDCSDAGPIPFKEWYGDLEADLHEFDFENYEYHSSYSLEGQFNWKTLSESIFSLIS